MTKNREKLLVWILVWASLLIAVLYSPVGSPGLYSSKNYYYDNQYVVQNKEVLFHAPKSTLTGNDNQVEAGLPELNQESKSIHQLRNFQSIKTVEQGSWYSRMQGQSYRNIKAPSEIQSQSGITAFARGQSRINEGNSTVVMTNGVTTLSSSPEVINSVSKQSIITDQPPGGTDPGGEPTGEPIPVGDGWGILIFSGVLYALIKLKKNHFRENKN